MTRNERIMRTMRGESVDRPAFNFYEITGVEDTGDSNPFNIYSDPSWKPLLELAAEKTDRMVIRGMPFKKTSPDTDPGGAISGVETNIEHSIDPNGSEISVHTIKAAGRTLTQRTKRDRDINTCWTTEHLLKDLDDFKAWLDLPEAPSLVGEVDVQSILDLENRLGDSGIVMLDTGDPLCGVAPLFDMGEYTVIAMTEPELFHAALQREARALYPKIEAVAQALPGRLWRIYGPEYATFPYLPPHLFHEYVTAYVKPMVDIIHTYGGFARIHSHGKVKDVLDHICATGCDGLDPIEPPHQGDVELSYVREKYGRQLVLFGNLEITDIENLPTAELEKKVYGALETGIGGRGFVLMPSAGPYGRKLSPLTVKNYEAIVKCVESF